MTATPPTDLTEGSTALLLDVDGTLLDSTYHHAVAWQRAFTDVDHPLPLWRLHRSVGMGGDRLVAAVAGDEVEERHGDELRDRWREAYAALRHEVVPLPGATDLVRSAVEAGHRVALASSGDPEFTAEAVALLDLEDLVEVVTSADDAESSKPASSLLETTLQRMPAVRRAVLVGDTPYDVESARRTGLACLTVRSGGYHDAELDAAGASLVVDAVADLVGLDLGPHLRPVPGS